MPRMGLGLSIDGKPLGVSVVGGGGPIENCFGSEGLFLDGEEMASTTFVSSAYDPQYHTAQGIVVPDADIYYAPQLSQHLRDLLAQPFTLILDGEFSASDDSSIFGMKIDEAVYLEINASQLALLVSDNTGYFNATALGATSPPPVGRYRFAVTKTNGSIDASVNGLPAVTVEGDDMPYEAINTAILEVRYGAKITEFTIMTPQSAVDLPALSAL